MAMSEVGQCSSVRPVGVLNIGNTYTTAAIVVGDLITRRWRQLTSSRTSSLLARVIGRLVAAGVDTLVIGSVVPAAGHDWRRAAHGDGRLRVLVAQPHLARHIIFQYPNPETLGADRLANIVAVAHRGRSAVIVIDAGTATTFDAVVGHRYLGGVIAPGPAMFYEYLADRTAQLPRLSPGETPNAKLGQDTVEAIQIGAEAGFAGMVRGIVERMRRAKGLRCARFVATGGAAQLVHRALRGASLDPDLTLRGLARLGRGDQGVGVESLEGTNRGRSP